MDTSTETLSKSIVDKILIQADIDTLLGDFDTEEDRFDPYSLTPIPRFDESTSVKYKKQDTRQREAGSDNFVSEVNIIGMKNGKLNGLCLTTYQYIKVDVPGVVGDYFIETDKLRQLLKEYGMGEYKVPYDDGLALVKLLCIDKQLLLDNCVKR